ncbi:hypothetical protein TWF694_011307 [Orbilia ellipsospora]
MFQRLELAWSMALLTRCCKFQNRTGDHLGELSTEIRLQGHWWYQRIFDDMLIISDIFQHYSAGSFLIEKKGHAFAKLKENNHRINDLGRAELRCLDDFEWRIGRTAESSESADFWKYLDIWERVKALRLFRRHNAKLQLMLHRMKEYDRKTVTILQNLDHSMRDESKRIKAIIVFRQYFSYDLEYLTPSDRIHLLLNQVDRVGAMIIYIASPNSFILKASQVEFLRQNLDLSRHPTQEQGVAASSAFNSLAEVFNKLFVMANGSKDQWYLEAMYRRIELSWIILLLNTRSTRYISGRVQFMQLFVQRHEANNFQKWQRLREIADTQSSVEKFLNWAVGNFNDLRLQSSEDHLLFCHDDQDPTLISKFRNFKIQITRLDDYLNKAMESEEMEANTIAETSLETHLSYPTDGDQGSTERKRIEAAKVIQKSWRSYSKVLRDKLYIENHPIHRRITLTLHSAYFATASHDDITSQLYRMMAFVLLEVTTDARSQLHRTRTKLEISSRAEKSSMEDIAMILEGFDVIQGYLTQVMEIERVIETPSLVGEGQDKRLQQNVSLQKNILEAIKSGRKLMKELDESMSKIDAWIGRDELVELK